MAECDARSVGSQHGGEIEQLLGFCEGHDGPVTGFDALDFYTCCRHRRDRAMKHFDLSEERLDGLFGPWLVTISVLLGVLLCWCGQVTSV
jgi:hypothetical protein